MAQNPGSVRGDHYLLFTNPWPALTVGVVLTAAASLWDLLAGQAAPLLVLCGLLASGIGVNIQPRSVLVLATAAFSGVLGWFGLQWHEGVGGMNWDSARALVAVLTAIAGLAALLVVLPRVLRRIVISVLVLFHFGGIVTAVTSIPPNPWLSNMAWTYVYRPYLEFFYLGNAYHFYSPDPGPGTQIWFYVQFEDGKIVDYMVADPQECPLALEYQRRISVTESVNQRANLPFSETTLRLRVSAGQIDGIPLYPDLLPANQYRPITPWYSKRMLESYVRYVAGKVRHPVNPDKKITGIKAYLAIHRIPDPLEIAKQVDTTSKWMYAPYYLGDHDAEGTLKDPNDPYLYWLIPILKEPIPVQKVNAGMFNQQFRPLGPGGFEGQDRIANFLDVHLWLKTGRFGQPGAIPGVP